MCNIIAEIGLNHGGDLTVAKRLIRQAKEAGCWGVKFQYREIESFYKTQDEVADTIIFEEIKKNFISIDAFSALAYFCKGLKINFGISLFRAQDLDKLDKIISQIDFFKVPSAECLNIYLLEELKTRNKPIFVSSGAHETDEVIKYLAAYKTDITLLHCISNYPTLLGTQDLKVISRYKENGFLNVGYSSHDDEWEVCLLALSEGAQWIERHITLTKDANGLDHSSSSTQEEFFKLVKFSSEFDRILGVSNHLPNQGELINLQNLGTSLYAKRDIKAGERTCIEDFEIKAPRVGISPDSFTHQYNSKILYKKLEKGKPLSIKNFSNSDEEINVDVKKFSRNKNIGLPVRLHDYLFIKDKFDLRTYEFHLSFSEALTGDFKRVVAEIDSEENISIHLPDYIPGSRLLDPISRDSEIKSISRELIQKVDKFARNIEDKTSKRVNIVGSFSKCHNKTRYDNLDEIFEYLYRTNTNILPQWLPVFAWYFGGSVKLDLFNSYEDIKYIKSNGCRICLDLSHLVMASCHYNASWKLWYEELLPFVEHLHISDAADATSEGLMFGDGMVGDFSNILSVDKLKIIECWQGHINEGEGFRQSLDILYRQSREGNV